uniref:Uncharacterized protein n=1 Tax=Clastoptera arizonana TaxID=38151 RepID=A0A1B6CPA1_9HEMI
MILFAVVVLSIVGSSYSQGSFEPEFLNAEPEFLNRDEDGVYSVPNDIGSRSNVEEKKDKITQKQLAPLSDRDENNLEKLLKQNEHLYVVNKDGIKDQNKTQRIEQLRRNLEQQTKRIQKIDAWSSSNNTKTSNASNEQHANNTKLEEKKNMNDLNRFSGKKCIKLYAVKENRNRTSVSNKVESSNYSIEAKIEVDKESEKIEISLVKNVNNHSNGVSIKSTVEIKPVQNIFTVT